MKDGCDVKGMVVAGFCNAWRRRKTSMMMKVIPVGERRKERKEGIRIGVL